MLIFLLGIFQDERLDIQREASRMAEVFGNALCNISALTGKHDGLFCTRAPEVVSSDCVVLDRQSLGLNQSYLLNDLQLWRGELLHMPLTSRGWVPQEELLAPRTIYFGSRQVLWDCAACRACETYPEMQRKRPLQLPPDFNEKQQFLDDEEIGSIASVLRIAKASLQTSSSGPHLHERQRMMFEVWIRFVAHYSLRALTFPADKLLAIAGVSKLFGMVMQDRSVAGLWRRHLIDGLLWYIRGNTSRSRPLVYRAPSWSWASIDGYVLHADPFKIPWTVARVLDARCNTEGGDELGVLIGGRLRLEAPCLHISVDDQGEWIAHGGTSSGMHRKFTFPRLIVRLDAADDLAGRENIVGAIVRTTAYRLTESASGEGKGNRKILLAAQGIILAPVELQGPSTARDYSSQTTAAVTIAEKYSRVGCFALEDRKSGTTTPKWAPQGCRIFHGPPGNGSDDRVGRLDEFNFEEQGSGLRVLDIS